MATDSTETDTPVAKESNTDAQKRKKVKKAAATSASKVGQGGDEDQAEFTKLDICVGQIVKVSHHEEADKLFCEEIDLGEESGLHQIASGRRGH